MKNTKKIAMGTLSAMVAIAAPIATVISCGKDKEDISVKEINIKEIEKKLNSIIKNENVELTIPFISTKATTQEQNEEYKEIIKNIWFDLSRSDRTGLTHFKLFEKLVKDEGEKIGSLWGHSQDNPMETIDNLIKIFENETKLSLQQAKQILSIKKFVFTNGEKQKKEIVIKDDILQDLKQLELLNIDYYSSWFNVYAIQVPLWKKWQEETGGGKGKMDRAKARETYEKFMKWCAKKDGEQFKKANEKVRKFIKRARKAEGKKYKSLKSEFDKKISDWIIK
ncbi:MAG: hypothetical protein HRT98_03320 [Mycoplasmatales bacterium]|nr:hypothetical protein [Mycoplasmatales bacterium]